MYARTDLSFMFKLFCYLFRWRGDSVIGRGKSTTLLLWPSCGQHFRMRIWNKMIANNSGQNSFILFCSGLEKFYKVAEIVWVDLFPRLFQLFTVLHIVLLSSLRMKTTLVDSVFLTSNSFSHPQPCLDLFIMCPEVSVTTGCFHLTVVSRNYNSANKM